MNRRIAVTAITAAVALGLAGCSSYDDKRGKGDAPVKHRDDSAAYVVNMPDGFANVAFKCHGTDGIYSTTREAAPVIVPNDANCKNGNG